MPPIFMLYIQRTLLFNYQVILIYAYGTITLYGSTFQKVFCFINDNRDKYHISNTFLYQIQFALYRVQSPLLTASLLISLPPGTKTFQFPGFPDLSIPSYECEVTFRHLGFKDYVRLPQAYCSLSHPSSAH